jgi:hypothetical protein
MSDLARQQAEFQRGILAGDDGVLTGLLDGAREKREALFGVYRYAYGARLVEALRNDHGLLHAYLGDEMFEEMASAYVQAHPSRYPNLRWFPQHLPRFLRAQSPYSEHPALGDLAVLENALNDAFDGRDGNVVTLADVAAFSPETWQDLTFMPHPTVARLNLATNAAAIWRALKADETPPEAVLLDEPTRLIVWRHETTPKFRELSPEEAMMWDEAANGISFGVLCTMLATHHDPDDAAARGASYLHGWVTGGLISSVSA